MGPLNNKENKLTNYPAKRLEVGSKGIPFTFALFWVAAVLSNQQLFLAAAKSFSVLYLEEAAS